MRKILFAFYFCAICVNTFASATTQQSNLQLFLIQTTKSATLQPIKGQKNQYHLKLKKVEPYVSYLADRPTRVFGSMSLQDYLALWTKGENNFGTNPPNVSIETAFKNNQNKRISIMGDISEPKYDAKTNTLTYKLTTSAESGPIPSDENMGYTIVFIDSAQVHWNPGGFGV